MPNPQENVKLELSPEQQRQILEATGREASEIQFTVEELEERIAPVAITDIVITKDLDKGTTKL